MSLIKIIIIGVPTFFIIKHFFWQWIDSSCKKDAEKFLKSENPDLLALNAAVLSLGLSLPSEEADSVNAVLRGRLDLIKEYYEKKMKNMLRRNKFQNVFKLGSGDTLVWNDKEIMLQDKIFRFYSFFGGLKANLKNDRVIYSYEYKVASKTQVVELTLEQALDFMKSATLLQDFKKQALFLVPIEDMHWGLENTPMYSKAATSFGRTAAGVILFGVPGLFAGRESAVDEEFNKNNKSIIVISIRKKRYVVAEFQKSKTSFVETFDLLSARFPNQRVADKKEIASSKDKTQDRINEIFS